MCYNDIYQYSCGCQQEAYKFCSKQQHALQPQDCSVSDKIVSTFKKPRREKRPACLVIYRGHRRPYSCKSCAGKAALSDKLHPPEPSLPPTPFHSDPASLLSTPRGRSRNTGSSDREAASPKAPDYEDQAAIQGQPGYYGTLPAPRLTERKTGFSLVDPATPFLRQEAERYASAAMWREAERNRCASESAKRSRSCSQTHTSSCNRSCSSSSSREPKSATRALFPWFRDSRTSTSSKSSTVTAQSRESTTILEPKVYQPLRKVPSKHPAYQPVAATRKASQPPPSSSISHLRSTSDAAADVPVSKNPQNPAALCKVRHPPGVPACPGPPPTKQLPQTPAKAECPSLRRQHATGSLRSTTSRSSRDSSVFSRGRTASSGAASPAPSAGWLDGSSRVPAKPAPEPWDTPAKLPPRRCVRDVPRPELERLMDRPLDGFDVGVLRSCEGVKPLGWRR